MFKELLKKLLRPLIIEVTQQENFSNQVSKEIETGVGSANDLFWTDHEQKRLTTERQTLEKETYDIFKATKQYPAIPKENEQTFFKNCQNLLNDEVLNRVIDELVLEKAEEIIQTAENRKMILPLRYQMKGSDAVRIKLRNYANMLEAKEEFNKFETI